MYPITRTITRAERMHAHLHKKTAFKKAAAKKLIEQRRNDPMDIDEVFPDCGSSSVAPGLPAAHMVLSTCLHAALAALGLDRR